MERRWLSDGRALTLGSREVQVPSLELCVVQEERPGDRGSGSEGSEGGGRDLISRGQIQVFLSLVRGLGSFN